MKELVKVLVYQAKFKNSSVAGHLLFCNHLAPYNGFSILTRENKSLLLELKKNLLINFFE